MRFSQLYPPACPQTPAPHKPEFSQHPARRDLTLSLMSAKPPQPVFTPAGTPRVRRTQGIALVVVLLSAMVLMVSLLAVTSTMVISSQRTTADQGATLQAQYAAEAGIARGNAMMNEIQLFIQPPLNDTTSPRLSIPTGQSSNTILGHIRNLCGGFIPSSNASSAFGPVLCTIPNPTPAFDNRYTLFTTYVTAPNAAYTSTGSTDAAKYWQQAFGGRIAATTKPGFSTTTVETKVSQSGGAESWYRVSYGLRPDRVVQLNGASDSYRLFFEVMPITATGEVRVGGEIVASRTIMQDTQPNPSPTTSEYYLDVFNPAFSRYVQFRDHTYQTTKDGGNHLAFGAGEQFDGPVHTNDQPRFTGSSTTNPLFTDEFTTAAATASYGGLSTADHSRMFPNFPPRFKAGEVDITENVYSQLRAAMGGDENRNENGATPDPVTNRELREGWGVGKAADVNKDMPNGVYFSKGNSNNKANNLNSWVGDPAKPSGIYVKGDVTSLKFSKTDNTATGRQVIEINQAGIVTRFEQRTDGNWEVKEQSGSTRILSGSFNGMIYVDGNVSSLGGDGGANNDIAANSQVTLASSGNIIVKDDITYTDNPTEAGKENAKNVLGIYTNGGKCGLAGALAACGSIELDGTAGKDLTVHATMMASREGQGFGTLNCGGEGCPNKGTVYDSVLKANRQVRINVLGGVIESQSQTVSSGENGYRRAYKYDKRFKTGFSPPFFPKRANWTAQTVFFSTQQQFWQTTVKR